MQKFNFTKEELEGLKFTNIGWDNDVMFLPDTNKKVIEKAYWHAAHDAAEKLNPEKHHMTSVSSERGNQVTYTCTCGFSFSIDMS